MSDRSSRAVIALTYGLLLAAWLVLRPASKRRFAAEPAHARLGGWAGLPAPDAGRTAGTLWVFAANIATLGWVLAAGRSLRLADRLAPFRLPLPAAVRWAGAALYVANGVWGTLALLFNPEYAPFFREGTGPLRLATRGPYALVRHPRYAGETSLNLILPALTGVWLPLLGVLGWPGMRRQAEAEEEYLLKIAPAAYGAYRARTGAFLPRLLRLNADWRQS